MHVFPFLKLFLYVKTLFGVGFTFSPLTRTIFGNSLVAIQVFGDFGDIMNSVIPMKEIFSSKRERNLWCLALLVFGVIFLNLWFGAQLVGLFQEGVLAGLFALCFVIVLVAILSQGLKVKPGGIELGVGLGILAVFLLLAVRLAVVERSHLLEFGVLAFLIYEALCERLTNRKTSSFPGVWAFLIAALVGVTDELVQMLLPTRVFDPRDILFNVLAALGTVLAIKILRWVRVKLGKTTE